MDLQGSLSGGYEEPSGSWAWWNQRRLAYNAALVAAVFVAFIANLMIGWSCVPRLGPQSEFTFSSILFQGIACVVVIATANFAYCAGPIIEAVVPKEHVPLYRKLTFWYGFWFSVTLPISVSVLVGVACFQGQ